MELSLQKPNDIPKKFPQFDSASDASDHHFYSKPCSNTTNTRFYKTIMKEWRILEKDLPPNIYVRIYENRIDLLRAVIVGASGTPYHDGLFFFDFFFPVQYPYKPPSVRYKSFGINVNPILYENGKICLSLLNTWFGPSWQPNESTVLQVLVSLQGLVLNEKPYYSGELFVRLIDINMNNASRAYTEEVFVSSCQTMIHLLAKPPLNFEEFVVEHFRDRGRSILTACKAYMNGYVKVGEYQDCGFFVFDQKVQVSKIFMFRMSKKYPNLFKSFVKNDPSLNDFRVQLDQLVEKTEIEYLQKTEIEYLQKANLKAEREYLHKANLKEKKYTSRWFSGIVKKLSGLKKCVKGNAD